MIYEVGAKYKYYPSDLMDGRNGGPGYISDGANDNKYKNSIIEVVGEHSNDKWIYGKFIYSIDDNYHDWIFVKECLIPIDNKYLAINPINKPDRSSA